MQTTPNARALGIAFRIAQEKLNKKIAQRATEIYLSQRRYNPQSPFWQERLALEEQGRALRQAEEEFREVKLKLFRSHSPGFWWFWSQKQKPKEMRPKGP